MTGAQRTCIGVVALFIVLALFVLPNGGCDVAILLQGRTFGTDSPRLAGLAVVDSEDELELDGTWPLPQVSLDCLEGSLSDEAGDFEGGCLCSHVLWAPLNLTPVFSKDSYNTERAKLGASQVQGRWLRVVLLKTQE